MADARSGIGDSRIEWAHHRRFVGGGTLVAAASGVDRGSGAGVPARVAIVASGDATGRGVAAGGRVARGVAATGAPVAGVATTGIPVAGTTDATPPDGAGAMGVTGAIAPGVVGAPGSVNGVPTGAGWRAMAVSVRGGIGASVGSGPNGAAVAVGVVPGAGSNTATTGAVGALSFCPSNEVTV